MIPNTKKNLVLSFTRGMTYMESKIKHPNIYKVLKYNPNWSPGEVRSLIQ